jgi:hypothetical protein
MLAAWPLAPAPHNVCREAFHKVFAWNDAKRDNESTLVFAVSS